MGGDFVEEEEEERVDKPLAVRPLLPLPTLIEDPPYVCNC